MGVGIIERVYSTLWKMFLHHKNLVGAKGFNKKLNGKITYYIDHSICFIERPP